MLRFKLINWLLLILVIMLGVNVVRSFIRISYRDEIVKSTYDKLQQVKDESESLKRKLAEVESNQYIEQEARNKLNLGKDGEIALIIPSISPDVGPSPTPIDKSSNLVKWLKLFL